MMMIAEESLLGLSGIMTVVLPSWWKIFSQNNNSNCDKNVLSVFRFFFYVHNEPGNDR